MSSRNKGAIRERRRKEGREIAARTPGISRHSCSRRERSFRLFTISVTFTFFNILFPNVLPPPHSRSASYPPFKAGVSPQYCWVEGAWSGQFEPFSLVHPAALGWPSVDLGVTGFRHPDARGNPSSRKVVPVLVLMQVFWALSDVFKSHGALPVFCVPIYFMNSSHPCFAVPCLRSVCFKDADGR